jgi:hypothetical protein
MTGQFVTPQFVTDQAMAAQVFELRANAAIGQYSATRIDSATAARRAGSLRSPKCAVLGHFERFSDNLRIEIVCHSK